MVTISVGNRSHTITLAKIWEEFFSQFHVGFLTLPLKREVFFVFRCLAVNIPDNTHRIIVLHCKLESN